MTTRATADPELRGDVVAAGSHRSLRILLASDYYPPFIGGVQRQVQLLARELTARGHVVEVATVWSPGSPREEEEDGVRIHRLRQIRSIVPGFVRAGKHHPPPFPDPVTTLGLRRIIKEFRPDVVHSYGWFSYSCAAALIGRPTPLVLSARDYAYGCAVRTLLYRGRGCQGPRLNRCLTCASEYYGRTRGWVAVLGIKASRVLLRRKVTAIHSISRYVRDIVRRDFVDDRRTGIPHVVLPSFREGHEVASPHTRLDGLPNRPFILYVGALRAEKGLHPLMEAYASLSDPPPLVLVGTRERDTPRVFPPGVVILEDLPHAAVMEAWRRSMFGVAPSLWPEPLGSVVYEGMSMSRAMIGTVPGGHSDMIEDGVTGRLVPAGDPVALAAAMQGLISDESQRRRFGEMGKLRSAQFTAAAVVPALEAVYAAVVRCAG